MSFKYEIPHSIFQEFLSVANNNVDKEGHLETLAYLVGSKRSNLLVATHLVFPNQVGTSIKVEDHGIDGNDTQEWIQSQMKTDEIVIGWIHSHVRDQPCNFSSVDVHSQFQLENIYEGIFGLVIEIMENGMMKKHDAFVLTEFGRKRIEMCTRKNPLSYSLQQHHECWNTNFYTSIDNKILYSFNKDLVVLNFMGNIESNRRSNTIDENKGEQCKGCKKLYAPNKIMKHISHSSKCKVSYGSEYDNLRNFKAKEREKLYKDKKKITKVEQNSKYYKEHTEAIRAKQNEYKKENRFDINAQKKQKIAKAKSERTPEDRFKAFKNDIKDGPIHVCMSCRREMFLRGVRIFEDKRKLDLEVKVTAKFLKTEILLPNEKDSPFYKFCHSCLAYIKQKKVPRIHFSNGLWLDPVPECLNLTELEQQLIARDNIFMKVRKLPRSGMSAIVDRVINVPLQCEDIQKTVTSLPRPPNKAGVVGVRLKRKMSYKNAHLEQFVRPNKLIESLEYLKDVGNPFYQDIPINRDFMDDNNEESDKEAESESEMRADFCKYIGGFEDKIEEETRKARIVLRELRKRCDPNGTKYDGGESERWEQLYRSIKKSNEEASDMETNETETNETEVFEKDCHEAEQEWYDAFVDFCLIMEELGLEE